MKLLLVAAVIATVFAKDWPVQDKEKCTPGTKFIDTKDLSRSFLRECIRYGRQDVYASVIGCLDDEGNEVKFGGTFDRIREPRNGHGFRFGCSQTNGQIRVQPVACIFGKGSSEEKVTTGYAALHSFNMGCTCKDAGYSYSCTMLKQ